MNTSKDCRSPAEYNRYHSSLSCFLEEHETVKAIGKEAVQATFSLKRTLRDKEPKLAGYVRHKVKNHMGAMTTSPTEGQNVHLRYGPDAIGQQYHTHTAIRKLITRIQRNFRKRKQKAHMELAQNTLFSTAWTRDFLIKKGQALIDRNHAKRRHYKSARLSHDEYIMWNFDIGDWLDLPHPLYHVIPHFLRICRMKLVSDLSGAKYARCICGEREGVGVPCSGFYKMCEDAGVSNQDMVHTCMVDVRYLKLYHTHYGKEGVIGDLMLQGQKDSFANEGKGTENTEELMHVLCASSTETAYPVLGKNTTNADLVEASFALDRDTTTVMDIERLRACDSKEDYEEEAWAERGLADDLHATENHSQASVAMKERIASSMEERNAEERRTKRPNENEKDLFYRKWHKFLVELGNDSRTTVLKYELADEMMEAVKAKLDAMTLADFPPSKSQTADSGPVMLGNYGDSSPQKPRKRGRGGL